VLARGNRITPNAPPVSLRDGQPLDRRVNRLIEVRTVRDGHGLDVGLVEFLPDVRSEDGHEPRRDFGDIVDLDLEERRVDVVPAGLERVELRSSEPTAVEEGLAVLEEIVRPGARMDADGTPSGCGATMNFGGSGWPSWAVTTPTFPEATSVPPSLFTSTPTPPARIRYRPFRTITSPVNSATKPTSTTPCVMSVISTMFFLRSRHAFLAA